MKCDKLFKEAFEGIEFRYKLDDTLENLGNQKLTAKQLEGFLLGKGVSPKEIKQSGVLDGMIDDNRALSGSDWLSRSGSQRLSTTILKGGDYGSAQFDTISLGKKGFSNETYKETLTGIVSPRDNIPEEPHFYNLLPDMPNTKEIQAKEAVDNYIAKEKAIGRALIDILKDTEYKKLYRDLKNIELTPNKPQSLLGWRRTHVDEINGKKTLVLNEFQSDWAQTERAGRGTFESNADPKRIEEHKSNIAFLEKKLSNLQDELSLIDNQITTITKKKDSISDKMLSDGQSPELLKEWQSLSNEVKELRKYKTTREYTELQEEFERTKKELNDSKHFLSSLAKNTVADFPMTELKHHQFQIVGAIDDALKQGIDTVAIPIQRENELMGSAGVTKFYENLNTKVLPDIRKKLEKQGLRIKVDKKPYTESKNLPGVDTLIDEMLYFARDNDYADMYTIGSKIADFESENGLIKSLDDLNKWARAFEYEDMLDDFLNTFGTKNDLWTLTIEEVPSGKVKWDVYSVLAALGLGGVATQSEATTKMQDNPDIYQLSKRVGAKLNYNESNKEIIDYITSIESGGDYKAKNKDSSAFGKYQILRGTMVEKAKELGITLNEARKPEGQEQVMNSLLSDYKERLKQFDLPVTKENVFVLHNLGQTRGVRILRGTYSDSDINAMRGNLPTQERKLPRSVIPQAYAERYNINVPNKQED